MTETKINWQATIVKPLKDFTQEEIDGLYKLSHSWDACACASLDVPKDEKGVPLDDELSKLCKSFHNDGVQWLCVYLDIFRKTPDSDKTSDGRYSLKEIRWSLAEKYQRQSIEILEKINKHIQK